jgi:polyisoprenoid-binding protein YceI
MAAGASAQSPGLYYIEPGKSRIEVHVYRAGFLGDNHWVVLKRFSGSAESPDGKSWKVHVVAEAGSLRVMDPGSSAGTRAEIQRTMLGPKQLDVTRFLRITLDSQSLKPGPSPGTWRMIATLTLHGVSRQEDYLISWQQKGKELDARGQKELRLTDFQIKPIRLAFGAIRVKNEFDVNFDVTLEREPPSTVGHAAR